MPGKGLTVAIKELQPSAEMDYPDPKTAWELELSALDGTSRHKHDHLTSAIAAFQKNGRYYFVFEWADGGSLQEFWENNKEPILSAALIQDVLEQLHGLADALVCLHGRGTGSEKFLESNPGDDAGHWRHGDLKPANILRFKCANLNPQKQVGTLQIADLGLARRHTVATRNRVEPTSMRYGTVMYEGPEAHPMNAKSRPRSRLYDVWSMGCIMLEFTIWLLYGHKGLRAFHDQTLDTSRIEDGMHQDLIGTNFYLVKQDRVEVNDIAAYWMTEIQKTDPEFNNGQKTALSDLLNLVKTKLLVIESDGNGNEDEAMSNDEIKTHRRATASELEKELLEMKTKGELDRGYLFTGRNRDNVVAPNKPKSPIQLLTVPHGRGLGIQGHQSSPTESAYYEETRIEVPVRTLQNEYTHVRRDGDD
ncbi:hypothetical protein SLS55_005007 [Diplodia seriata]|uniref:Protein kinase domain-containing protein n=1 Tax=Diplodia seriata TaxID=420778 RepID=A0ABR3CKZ9_9PEZI